MAKLPLDVMEIKLAEKDFPELDKDVEQEIIDVASNISAGSFGSLSSDRTSIHSLFNQMQHFDHVTAKTSRTHIDITGKGYNMTHNDAKKQIVMANKNITFPMNMV